MKNANVFIDVDHTLVDASRQLLPGAREGLLRLRQAGYHLFLWSSCGAEYCRQMAALHKLTELFEGFVAKPDIIVDDMPATCVPPFAYNVQTEVSWEKMTDRILAKHIDS